MDSSEPPQAQLLFLFYPKEWFFWFWRHPEAAFAWVGGYKTNTCLVTSNFGPLPHHTHTHTISFVLFMDLVQPAKSAGGGVIATQALKRWSSLTGVITLSTQLLLFLGLATGHLIEEMGYSSPASQHIWRVPTRYAPRNIHNLVSSRRGGIESPSYQH